MTTTIEYFLKPAGPRGTHPEGMISSPSDNAMKTGAPNKQGIAKKDSRRGLPETGAVKVFETISRFSSAKLDQTIFLVNPPVWSLRYIPERWKSATRPRRRIAPCQRRWVP